MRARPCSGRIALQGKEKQTNNKTAPSRLLRVRLQDWKQKPKSALRWHTYKQQDNGQVVFTYLGMHACDNVRIEEEEAMDLKDRSA